jgi:hypothetical protein
MQRPDRPLASRPDPVRRTAAWVGLAFVAAGGSCALAPSVMAASAAPSCPSGQIAATRIDYEGKYNLDPTVEMWKIQALVPNVGYTRRTVLVANGYYKEVSEGMIAVVKDKGPGKAVPMPGITLYARELPSRFVIVETPQQRLVYDERGDPEHLGTRTIKSKQVSATEKFALARGLQTAVASSGDKIKVLGKATYAGIPCEVRQAFVPGDSLCIASVRGQHVTLAEVIHSANRAAPSRMQAKAKADVCVSTREFEPPAHVRFKPTEGAQRKDTQAQREADEEDDAFFEEARRQREDE